MLPGAYQVAVWIRQRGSAALYEAGAGGNYQLTGCASAGLNPAPGAFTRGSSVAFTANAGGCTSPDYEFWIKPSGGSWRLVQPYGASPNFSWNTAGLAAGAYDIAVWVRQHGSGATSYEAGAGGTYSLT